MGFSHLALMAIFLSSEIQFRRKNRSLWIGGRSLEGAELQELALPLPSVPAFILETGSELVLGKC